MLNRYLYQLYKLCKCETEEEKLQIDTFIKKFFPVTLHDHIDVVIEEDKASIYGYLPHKHIGYLYTEGQFIDADIIACTNTFEKQFTINGFLKATALDGFKEDLIKDLWVGQSKSTGIYYIFISEYEHWERPDLNNQDSPFKVEVGQMVVELVHKPVKTFEVSHI